MRHRVSEIQAEKLAQDLKELRTRSDDELKERWRHLYGTEPPRKIHRSLLLPAIAHRMQENALGGLKPSVRRHLMRVAKCTADGSQSQSYPSLIPRPGTVLVRDWGGVTHQVKVLESGVLFRSKRYKSLSEVARVITGARWSGPLFFGLKSAVKEQSQWNPVKLRVGAVQSTPANHLKKASNRTLIPYRRSATVHRVLLVGDSRSVRDKLATARTSVPNSRSLPRSDGDVKNLA